MGFIWTSILKSYNELKKKGDVRFRRQKLFVENNTKKGLFVGAYFLNNFVFIDIEKIFLKFQVILEK